MSVSFGICVLLHIKDTHLFIRFLRPTTEEAWACQVDPSRYQYAVGRAL